MKIRNLSCTQFAGIRNRSISFEDGINVVYGKNESGKSTLVNLLSRTLFQNAKLDRRSNKEFFDLFFPGAKKGGGLTGDFADGKITFEAENVTYTLSKEWSSDPRCLLSCPDGVIRDQGKIDSILKDALLYGEGVYSEMLLSSQRNTDSSLQTILDASKRTDAKQEIVDAVSQAFAESDGISVDSIEQAITARIDEIAGKHWDFDRELPVKRAARWSSGLGEILKAYYAMEDARAVLDEISGMEREADSTAADYYVRDAAVSKAEEECSSFGAFASRLAIQGRCRKAIERIEKELAKIGDVLSAWPKLVEQTNKAKALQAEKADRDLLDKYEAAKIIADEIARLESKAANMPSPDETEIVRVRTVQRDLAALENKLCGMNLTAAFNMLGGHTFEVISLRTGERIDASEGIASVTEAVKIIVPDVMELRLSPADVDVASIESKPAECKKIIADIYARYGVDSLETLESLAKTAAENRAQTAAAVSRLSVLLGTVGFDELEAAAKNITADVRSRADIADDIAAVCGNIDAERFVIAKEAAIESYVADYGSVGDLEVRASALKTELEKEKESISGAEDIPAEYLSIADPEAHLEKLQNDLKAKQKLREEALTARTAAASILESYRENLSGDPADEAENAKRIFEEQKSLLSHWLRIRNAFNAQKEKINNNPMQDIADRFTGYLGVISGGKISSEFPEADKLNMNIYSDDRLLDYGKLSEGTKETVSLAFRLAVLDHLFPDGGGVVVLDDPFTDMDAERTAQSCKLIRDCAERHQVIFLTCREEYIDMLNGNTIRL